jgi:sugar (pentulose or hexulose) kinase
MKNVECVCGLDVGTSGAKALAVDQKGRVIARAESRFAQPPYIPAPGRSEQDAEQWWGAVKTCLRQLSAQMGNYRIVAVATDSTSGTIVPVDGKGSPLIPAMMYNDDRASGLQLEVQEAAKDLTERLGYSFPSVFSLVKLVWLRKEKPDVLQATHKFLHAADFIVGRLTGNFDSTDTSNALKSGVDLISGTWPEFIEFRLGLPLSKFPKVFRPGEKLGEVSVAASEETDLKAGTPVIAGASDGTASFLASGTKAPGDWNFNLGTTLAIRGISVKLIRDPKGRLYCHRHPEGYWLPGGASNVGGEVLLQKFGEKRLSDLDRASLDHLPTRLTVYPLIRRGERMPFVSSQAEGFVLGKAISESELYAGYLEGIAAITMWSIEETKALGADVAGEYFFSGGGGRGEVLGHLMASAVRKSLVQTKEPEAAMGSALLAAGWCWYKGSVSAAQAQMVQREKVFEPIRTMIEPLTDKLEALKKECQRRGYL